MLPSRHPGARPAEAAAAEIAVAAVPLAALTFVFACLPELGPSASEVTPRPLDIVASSRACSLLSLRLISALSTLGCSYHTSSRTIAPARRRAQGSRFPRAAATAFEWRTQFVDYYPPPLFLRSVWRAGRAELEGFGPRVRLWPVRPLHRVAAFPLGPSMDVMCLSAKSVGPERGGTTKVDSGPFCNQKYSSCYLTYPPSHTQVCLERDPAGT